MPLSSKAKKVEEYVTVVLVPGAKGSVRRFSVRKKVVRLLSAAGIGGAVLTGFLAYQYVDMAGRVWELEGLRKEMKAQKLQVQSFTMSLGDMDRQLMRLKDLDLKIRRMAGISGTDRAAQLVGIGGSPQNPSEAALAGLANEGRSASGGLPEPVEKEIKEMQETASRQEVSFQRLIEYFETRRSLMAATPSGWPVRGWTTSGYGNRPSPFHDKKVEFHQGIDIAAQSGVPVLATADGIVSFVGENAGYGRYVVIDHGYGYRTLYGHNSRVTVSGGQFVRRGQKVAHVGSTGATTGPHLHYEVYVNNLPVNPKKFIN